MRRVWALVAAGVVWAAVALAQGPVPKPIVHNPGEAYGAVRALDALSGERRWEHRLLSPLWAGLMATAGGLVFGSTNEGNVFALDADTGRPLWDFQTGGVCYANPVSFLFEGHQHVAVACGQALVVFGLP